MPNGAHIERIDENFLVSSHVRLGLGEAVATDFSLAVTTKALYVMAKPVL